MAELVKKIQDLTSLDEQIHWFCPRQTAADGSQFFDEDLQDHELAAESEEKKAVRQARIAESRGRITQVLDACTILAYDGAEAQQWQKQLKDGLRRQLTRCDICVREFHRSRGQLKVTLESQYAADEVGQFMFRFDSMNNARISAGLNSAVEMLHDLEPEKRNIVAAGEIGMYALFEALNCMPFLEDEDLLEKYFDKPFQMVQSKKKIKLPSYAPGMAAFLFSSNDERFAWASKNFSSIKRPLTGTEFEYAVKPALEQVLPRVRISFLDQGFLPRFWHGTRSILSKLTKDVVTDHLRAMDFNLISLSIEHFQIDGAHFNDLTASYKILLELSPHAFWDAMGACTPQQLIEQIFKSPTLERALRTVQETEPIKLEDKLAWIPSFLKSIKASNLVPPVRVLLDQLLKRCQEKKYSRYSQGVTWSQGLSSLFDALRLLRTNVRGGPVLTHMVELVAKDYIGTIMEELEGIEKKDEMRIDPSKAQCLLIVRELLALDVQSIAFDHAMIAQTKGLDHELGISSLKNWKMSLRAVKPGQPQLPIAIIAGVQGLLPLERFASRQVLAAPKQAQDWNSAFDKVLTFVSDDFLERLGAFGPDQIVEIFLVPEGAAGLMALLFSGEKCISEPTISLLKTLSSEDSRRDSLRHILKLCVANTLSGVVAACTAIAKRRSFAPAITALKLCTDIYACLCDGSGALLKSAKRLDERDLRAVESYWQVTWKLLGVIFEQTEIWSNYGHDKGLMQEFCREAMGFADFAFNQYGVIANVLQKGAGSSPDITGKKLLEFPKASFTAITRWLRLRDDYLVQKAVGLTVKMLSRLHDVNIEVSQAASEGLENVLSNKTKTKLSMNHKAEIQRALEQHFGTEVSSDIIDLDAPMTMKQSSLQEWASSASSRSATPIETAKARKAGSIDFDSWKNKSQIAATAESRKSISQMPPASEAFKKRQEAAKALGKKALGPATVKAVQNQRDDKSQSDFVAARKRAKEEAERSRAAALAGAKGVGIGSGVSGLGDIGKDHSMKGQTVFASSDEEESDDGDFGIFNNKTKEKRQARGAPNVNPNGAIGLRPEQKEGPTRIKRTARSTKDMRARLAPDLSSLHMTILKWDFFHDGNYPPGSSDHQFRQVSDSFTDPTTYQQTFRPLLTLEAWQGMVKAREENQNKSYEIKIISRSSVDQFIEISSSVSQVDNRELSLQEGDIILLSTAKKPTEESSAPNCLARIYRVKRQKGLVEIVYQLSGGSLASALSPSAMVHGVKIQSITPLEREYGAMQALQYYDLCNQIIKAKPSPRIQYSEKQIAALQDVYNVNRAQSEAVNAALDNEGFSLIQGPPGSGKTKTIVAIVGGLLSNALGLSTSATKISVPGQVSGDIGSAAKKLLVCAPSNAAVDEIVMRLKDGVKTKTGKQHHLNIVRIGRSDAINANVVDVTMDELVAKQLGSSNDDPKMRQKKQALYDEHQKVSAHLKELYQQRDSGKGDDQTGLQIVAVRKRKNELSIQIDNSQDQERQAGREAELSRKKAQQAVLDKAHVICATLSGSGHDMFQHLNIEFETVIIDEAAQCVEMSSLIPLKYGCVKCIMVGDPKQLPPTVFSKEAARFQYEQSLFVRMQNNFANEVHLLDTQYRMHPDISIFPSRTFYDGMLKDGDNMAELRVKPWHRSSLLAPYRFYDVKGQHQSEPKGHSLVNYAEIDVAIALYTRIRTDYPNYDFNGRIGIITPYKSQLRALKAKFSTRFGAEIVESVEFNTTDAFQGRESEIIIFSCVRASPAGGIGFLQDIRRMNVGLTRAKSSLWVLGNTQSLSRGQYWKKMVDDAKARDSIVKGDVMRMLQQPSSAYPADNLKTTSMYDVDSHVPQLQPGNNGQAPPVAGARHSVAPNGAPGKTDRSGSGSAASRKPSESSRMEGVTYKFEDRISANKKRPASETGGEGASRPRTGAAKSSATNEDVEMQDAQPVESTKPFTGLDGTMSRAETPLSGGEKADVRVGSNGGTKQAVAPTVPQPPIRRKKKPADPFLARKK